jgi:hypothetical protein
MPINEMSKEKARSLIQSFQDLKNYESRAIRQIGWDPFSKIKKSAILYIPKQTTQDTSRRSLWQVSHEIKSTSIEQINFVIEDDRIVYSYLLAPLTEILLQKIPDESDPEPYTTLSRVENVNHSVGDAEDGLFLHLSARTSKGRTIAWMVQVFLQFDD